MKVQYADVVDWHWKADILRTNPMFHNRPRYDFALVQIDGNKCIFVQLLCIFTITLDSTLYRLALVLPLDAPRSRVNRLRDEQLRLTCVRARSRSSAQVIPADKIVRGGLLTKDGLSETEYLVIDVIDEDMWRRLKQVDIVTGSSL